jgi:phosphoribosyl 1,2-cyclic phosphodiesterase
MQARFWGTRGSIPTPGRLTEKYGGNTACVEVTEGKSRVILDGGTGIRELGIQMAEEGSGEAVVLFSHCHWDHIQGLPFFIPFFKNGWRFRIIAPPLLSTRIKKILGKQMESAVFPVDFGDLASEISFEEMPRSGVRFGPFRINAFPLNHPGGSAGYRITSGRRTMVYATDNEFDPGHDAKGFSQFVKQLVGADLYIADGQYFGHEYGDRIGWGHSTVEATIAAARHAHVKRLAITHHDPMHADSVLTRHEQAVRKHPHELDVFFAREGLAVEV